MTDNLVELDAHRPIPHVIVQSFGPSGDFVAHVVPLSVARGWADGSLPLPEPEIVRGIVKHWLDAIGGGAEP